MRTRRATALFVCTGLLGVSAACSAVLGITEFTPGDAGARDGATGPEGDGGATCGDGGASAVGCACSQAGQLGCNGNAQGQTLICNAGVWAHRSTCPKGQNCDSRSGGTQGTCAPVDPTCMGAKPNQAVCANTTTAVQCGPDLISETPIATCSNQVCVAGSCGGTCVPDTTQCAGTGLQTCGADGQWHATMTCAESCSDGGCGSFPSCAGGGPGAGADCGGEGGDAGTSDCCASFPVTGGTFDRGYDPVSAGFMSQNSPASISSYRLDAYEVTVGRFRSFVSAVVSPAKWLPDAGSGKHTHLNGGNGLATVGTDAGSNEGGWSSSWNANLASTEGDWNTALSCPGGTWTTGLTTNEHQPIACVTWYEAYAFCIWDGGFLPSEAEWNYAASGGTEQRVYPWSVPPTSTTIDCAHANYSPMGMPACSATGATDVGFDSPAGDGKYGQADLAGNVWEWTLDSAAPYVTPCTDCTNAAALSAREVRGGSYSLVASALITSYRTPYSVTTRDPSIGLRCARTP